MLSAECGEMQIAEELYAKTASRYDRAVWIRLKNYDVAPGLQTISTHCATG